MRHLFVATLGFFAFPHIGNTTESFCTSTDGINKISEYISCQAGTGINACAGVATAVAGNYMTRAIEKNYLKSLQLRTAEIAQSLEARLNQQWLTKEVERLRVEVEPLTGNGQIAQEMATARNTLTSNQINLNPVQNIYVEHEYAPRNLTSAERLELLTKIEKIDAEINTIPEISDENIERRQQRGRSNRNSPQQRRIRLYDQKQALIQQFYEKIDYRSTGPLREVFEELVATTRSSRVNVDRLEIPTVDQVERTTTLRQKEIQIIQNMQEQNRQLEAKLAEFAEQKQIKLAQQSRTNDALERIRAAKVKNIFDSVTMTDTDSQIIPQDVRMRNQQIAAEVAQKLSEEVASGKVRDPQSLITATRNTYLQVAHPELPDRSYLAWESNSFNSSITQALEKIQKDEGTALQKALGRAFRITKGLGTRAPLVVGGLVGVVAGEILGSSPTACAEIIDNHINRDNNNRCVPHYQVNDSVVRFLNLPQSEQLKAMEDPRVCDFYKNLHQKFYRSAKMTSLKCSGSGFTIETHTAEGKIHKDQVVYRNTYSANPDGIRQITIQEPGLSPTPIEIDRQDQLTLPSRPEAVSALMQVRLYISDAYSCCTTPDDTERTECLANYNSSSYTPKASDPLKHVPAKPIR